MCAVFAPRGWEGAKQGLGFIYSEGQGDLESRCVKGTTEVYDMAYRSLNVLLIGGCGV